MKWMVMLIATAIVLSYGCATMAQAANLAPIADAGSDQATTDNDDSGDEPVTLDGSGSSDADGTIVSYAWAEAAQPVATGPTAQVTLDVGPHTITLTVTDDDDATATDTVAISVFAAAGMVQLDLSAGFNVDAICGALEFQQIFYYRDTYDPDQDLMELQGGLTDGVGWDIFTSTTLPICATSAGEFDEPYSRDGWGAHPKWKGDAKALPEDGVIEGADRTYHMASHMGNATYPGDWTEVAAPVAGPPESLPNMAKMNNAMFAYAQANLANGQVASLTAALPADQQQTYSSINFVLGAPAYSDGARNMRIVAAYDDGSEEIIYSFSTANQMVGPCVKDDAADVYAVGEFRVVEQFTEAYVNGNTATGNTGTQNGALFEFAAPLALDPTRVLVAIRLEDSTPTLTSNARGLAIFAASAFAEDPNGSNLRPIADAGPRQTVANEDHTGSEPITLDGSTSSDADGHIVQWVWLENDAQIAAGSVANITMDVGPHLITLEVTDNQGAIGIDTVVIIVTAAEGYGTYYVDFDGGDDDNDGLTPLTPWRRCPGDPNAAGTADSTPLLRGDTVIFKGGVIYRGLISCTDSGEAGIPIVYDGNTAGTFGEGRAIIDGSVPVSGWTQCASADDAGGNPNYADIYWTWAPAGVTAFGGMFEDGERLYTAVDPNSSDPFYHDLLAEYNTGANIGDTTITHASYFTQTDPTYWDGATYVRIWAGNNSIATKAATGYDPTSHTLNYESLGATPYPQGSYQMVNSLKILDVPGEYVVREDLVGPTGGPKVFVYPHTPGAGGKTFSVAVEDGSFMLGQRSYITIRGFILRNSTDEQAAIRAYVGAGATDITIEDNIITNQGSGGINLHSFNNVTIADNEISYIYTRGVLLSECSDALVIGNTVSDCMKTGICFFTVTDSSIIDNTVDHVRGLHGNGITVYLESDNVDVIGNTVTDGQIAFTCQRSDNLLIAYNIFHTEMGIYAAAAWDGCDTVAFYNNVVQNTVRTKCGLLVGSSGNTNFVAANNIFGGSDLGKQGLAYNNAYFEILGSTPLGTGEFMATLDELFVDAANLDFRLKPGSPAIDAGVDLGYTTDIVGAAVPNGGAVDLGAYEYYPAATPGDANGDGNVDLDDFVILKQNFGTPSGATQATGDFDGDGDVDLDDFVILKQNFGT